MPATDHFLARATKGLSEGLYKIYVGEGALHGAKVAGVVYDEPSARIVTMHFGLLGFLIGKWLGKRAVTKREAKERSYDGLEPGSQSFLAIDKANFSLGVAQITKARVYVPQGFMAKLGDKTIVCELSLLDGSKRIFGLVGETGPERVRGLLAKVVANVESS